MNKEQAAQYLGTSVRTLQRLTGKGKIPVTYERGHKGDEARYDQEDLDQYRQSQKPAALIRPGRSATGSDTGNALQAVTHDVTRGVPVMASEAFFGALAQMAAPVRVSEKLLLSLAEAAQLAGLSRDHLRTAIHEGKLKARIIGRGYKVKKQVLEAYVSKL